MDNVGTVYLYASSTTRTAVVSGVGTGMLVDAYGWNGAIWLYGISALIGSALLALTWSQTAATAARERA